MSDQLEQVSATPGLPRLGSPAPQFEAATTHGTIRLEDFRGSWLILFSHPADFTPVCTTEFIAFAGIQDELREMNCELMGLSIDSVYSHIAWARNIEEKMGVKIDFPIIADLNKEVAALYGMVMPGESKTETSRCVFVIDPNQVLRAMVYYPLTTGRNVDEVLRLIQALQTTDEHQVATPANWRPGDKVILPPPATRDAAEERVNTKGLDALSEPRTPEQIREIARQPLYRVRASLREMGAAGYVSTADGRWRITEAGRAALERPVG